MTITITGASFTQQADPGTTVSNTQVAAPMVPPSVVTQEELAFGFSTKPNSGLLYHPLRNDVEILVNNKQALLLSETTTTNTQPVVIDISRNDFGPMLQALVLNKTSTNTALTLSGAAGLGNVRSSPVKYADITIAVANTLSQVITHSSQIVLGSPIPIGLKTDFIEHQVGNILFSAASTNHRFNPISGSIDSVYGKGGSIFMLSGEGGVVTGEIVISSHDSQDMNAPLHVTSKKALRSGTVTLKSGNVQDLSALIAVGVSPSTWETTPLDAPRSGDVNVGSGTGTSTGDVTVSSGNAQAYADTTGNEPSWYNNAFGRAGKVTLRGGDLLHYTGFTGPTVMAAGTVVVRAGSVIGNTVTDSSKCYPGEVVLAPGKLGSSNGNDYHGLIRTAGTAGIQIPYGSTGSRPNQDLSSGYWSGLVGGNPTYTNDVSFRNGVGVLRCTQTAFNEYGWGGTDSPVWLEMWNGTDWQRFYSEDHMSHQHLQATDSNQWDIVHNKGENATPLVEVYVEYTSGGPSGYSGGGMKKLADSEFEVYLPTSVPNKVIIVFPNAAYAGKALIRFIPNDSFTSGYAGNGNGVDGRGPSS
jgi:hypothetical protein